ncbi:hypothetical protein HDV05_001025 [Chytridiales sp. JEL 0842]|nr:hypothetical protein HDV05_001025 [Chytridiales sp. JEL 0842]
MDLHGLPVFEDSHKRGIGNRVARKRLELWQSLLETMKVELDQAKNQEITTTGLLVVWSRVGAAHCRKAEVLAPPLVLNPRAQIKSNHQSSSRSKGNMSTTATTSPPDTAAVHPFWFPNIGIPKEASWRTHSFEPYTALEVVYLFVLSTVLDKPEWYRKKDLDEVRSKWNEELRNILENSKTTMLTRRNARALDVDHFIKYLFEELDAIATASGLEKLKSHPIDLPASPAISPIGPHGVYVSDNLIPSDIHSALLDKTAPLEAEALRMGRWHPDSNNQVLDLVHPSFYPLCYGFTAYSQKTEGSAPVLFPDTILEYPGDKVKGYRLQGDASKLYQWIPSEVELYTDSAKQLKAKFTSYINNLNPRHYGPLYSTIASIFSRMIPMFDNALQTLNFDKRVPVRRIDAVRDQSAYQQSREDFEVMMWIKHKHGSDVWKEGMSWSERKKWMPAYGSEGWAEYEEFIDNLNDNPLAPPPVASAPEETVSEELRPIEIPPLPPQVDDRVKSAYTPPAASPTLPHLTLKEGSKLQVIVKLATIHLTPASPHYSGGAWHIEGMENEAIACTGLFYYDMHNITTSKLTFRHAYEDEDFDYPQSDFQALEEVFGFRNEETLNIQNLGWLSAQKGRCVVFPNFLQHRVEPFGLEDPTKPGYRKILAFFVIHPDYKIASSKDIPPQETLWAGENLYHDLRNRLPLEVCQKIASFRKGKITAEECEAHVKNLMEERKKFVNDDVVELRPLFLCEH